MQKLLMLVSVLLLGVSWVAAQNSAGYGQQGSSHASAGSQTAVEGCLGGADGKYTLTDKQGNTIQLTGDTSKLAEHVGHGVRITGTTSSAEGGGMGKQPTGAAGSSQQSMDVSSVKHISKSCRSNSGGMAH